MRLTFFLLLILLLVGPLAAQPAGNRDAIAIHLDKPFYINGELIWYKIYLPPAFSGKALTLKVALIHPAGKSLENYFLATKGKTVLDGYFKLPYDLEPARYHLVVMGTERNAKERIKLAEVFIPVYNDLIAIKSTANTEDPKPVQSVVANDLQVSIQLAPGPYQKRQEIRATVQVTDQAGKPLVSDLSVSVIDAALLGRDSDIGTCLKTSTLETTSMVGALDNKISLIGRMTDLENNSLPEIAFGAYLSREKASLVAETDQNGVFTLSVPDLKGEAALQFINLRGERLQVKLDDGISLAESPPLVYSEAVRNYLKWSQSRKMIYQLYNSLETSLQPEQLLQPGSESEPDRQIIPKEYAGFPDLYTFFSEINTPLKIKMDKEGGYYAQMFNPDPRMRVFYPGAPIFIVDDKMTRDVNFLQQLDISKIDTIDLYFDFFNLNTNFGKLGNSGMVMVKTSIPNLTLPSSEEANIVAVNGLMPAIQLKNTEAVAPRQPIFKPQLFWAPNLITTTEGTADLNFSQSDDLGTFQIEVVARAADGRIGYGTQTYQVQW